MTTAVRDADELAVRYRYLPRYVAKRLCATRPEVARLGLDEAEAVGLYYLLQAARHFDPGRGVRFSTYAHRAIALEIRKAALGSTLIRVPLYQTSGRHPGDTGRHKDDVARAFTVGPLPRFADSGREAREPLAPVPPCPLESADERRRLRKALRKLPPRWRQVVRLRFGLGGGGPLTLQQVGDRLGCTRENVRQTEQKALARLRKLLGDSE